MIELVLVLLTVVAVAAAAAMAPGRVRARAARRHGPVRRAPRPRSRRPTFLAVCTSCLEMVETHEALGQCPACGGELGVRRRIRSAGRSERTPVGR